MNIRGFLTRLAALAAAAYAASASAVGLGLLGGPVVQPLLAASSTAAVALALASRPRPLRGSWGLPAAAAAAAVGLAFALLVAGFGASLNPAAPTPLAGLLNVALLLPQALAPVAAALLLPASAAPPAAALLSLAPSPPTAGLGGVLSAAARASPAAVAAYAAGRWGLAAGLLYASVASMPRLLLPVAPAAPAALAAAVTLGAHAAAALLLVGGGARRPPGFPALAAVLAVAALAVTGLAASRGYYLLVVATGSMEPEYRPGDVVLVAPGRPEPGEVAAYIQPGSGRVILHRLVADDGGRLVFKGDANVEPDPPVPREALLGVAAARLPRIGLPYIVLGEALGTPLAPPLLLAAAAGLLAWRSRPDD